MAYSALNEKKDEIISVRIKDDGMLNDALGSCLLEARALVAAFETGDIDDRLATGRAMFEKIKASIVSVETLEKEASDALSAYRERGDIEAFKARRAA